MGVQRSSTGGMRRSDEGGAERSTSGGCGGGGCSRREQWSRWDGCASGWMDGRASHVLIGYCCTAAECTVWLHEWRCSRGDHQSAVDSPTKPPAVSPCVAHSGRLVARRGEDENSWSEGQRNCMNKGGGGTERLKKRTQYRVVRSSHSEEGLGAEEGHSVSARLLVVGKAQTAAA